MVTGGSGRVWWIGWVEFGGWHGGVVGVGV